MQTQQQERRKGPDLLSKTIRVIGLVCSSLLILSMLLIDRAKPRIETFFDRLLGMQLQNNWDSDLLLSNYHLVIAIFTLSIAGLLFNTRRARRQSDSYSRTLIFLAIISLSALIFFKVYNFHLSWSVWSAIRLDSCSSHNTSLFTKKYSITD